MKITIFIIFISLQVHSADISEDTSCRYRNLMEDNWLRLRNQVRQTKRYVDMPAYDQQGTNTCYGFAATQLVDYWRQSRGFMPDEQIGLASPIYMALIFKMASGKTKSIMYGSLSSSIKALKEYGLCPKEVVAKDLINFLGRDIGVFRSTGEATGGKIESDVVFAELTQGFMVKTPTNLGIGDLNNITFEDYVNWAKNPNQSFFIKNMDRKTLKKVYDALNPYFKENNYVGFLENVLKSCKNKNNLLPYLNQMPPPRNFSVDPYKKMQEAGLVKNWSEYTKFRNNKNKARINYFLNLPNAPAVGIRYCAQVIKSPGEIYFNEKGQMSGCIDHFSIIVGKREVKGECQYLLKNTWNRSDLCDKHGGCIFRSVVDPKTNKSYKEEVGMWVGENDLLYNLDSITYIYPETQEEKNIEERWRRIEEKYIQSGEAFKGSLQKIRMKKN